MLAHHHDSGVHHPTHASRFVDPRYVLRVERPYNRCTRSFMTPRQLDLAAEFCKRVGATNLLSYLGMSAETTGDDARAALKARRRKMQGMQANPKYADEAKLVIKHFQMLDAVLSNPKLQVQDMAKRLEARNLPALEMSIRTALAGGPLSPEQTIYLRSSAVELGVSDTVFDDLLHSLEHPTNPVVDRATAPTAPSPTTARRRPPPLPRNLLDIAGKAVSTSTPPAIQRSSSPHKRGEKRPTPQKKNQPPGPPHRQRSATKLRAVSVGDLPTGVLSEAATAPPVRSRSVGPSRDVDRTEPRPMPRNTLARTSSSIEIIGDAVRDVIVTGRTGTIDLYVRLLGDLPIAASVTTDDDWLTVEPQRLAPEVREHVLRVTIDARKMFNDTDDGNVLIYNDIGDQVGVHIRATRRFNWYPYLLTSAILTSLLAILALSVVSVQSLVPSLFPSQASSLTIQIDPSSDAVLLDGQPVGSGKTIRIDHPEATKHEIIVLMTNFKDFKVEIELRSEEDHILPVRLELNDPLNNRPQPEAKEQILPEDAEKRRALENQFQPCIAKTPQNYHAYDGKIIIYLGRDGQVQNIEFMGNTSIPAAVATCLRRQAATVRYPRLKNGDYAVMKAEFSYP
ncbi:MAG: hypothetical protein ACI9MC_001560 [Kiritimatiellia bacterium]|jgi:hypothetical protein